MFLSILAAIFALLVLVLLTPVRATVLWQEPDGFRLRLYVAGIRVFRVPAPKKHPKLSNYSKRAMEKRRRKQQKALMRQQKKHPQKTDLRPPKDTAPLTEKLSFLVQVIRTVIERTAHHVRITVDRLMITVGSPDAAQTALLFGAISPAVAFLCETLFQYSNLRIKHMDRFGVSPDFTADRIQADVCIHFHLQVWQMLAVALRAGLCLIGQRLPSGRKCSTRPSKGNAPSTSDTK